MLSEVSESISQYTSSNDDHSAVYILVFKTNITTAKDIKTIETVLADLYAVKRWNVDKHDVDKVLRIVANSDITTTIITLVTEAGFLCEELTD